MTATEQPLKREFWRPDEDKVWVHKQARWGVGLDDQLGGSSASPAPTPRRRGPALASIGNERGLPARRSSRPPWVLAAGLATTLAFGSATVSLYWTLGGTLLLDTVGGSIERLARTRSVEALLLGGGVTLAKIAAGLLSLVLIQPHSGRLLPRLLTGLNLMVSVGLVAWGAANVFAGALVLGGVLTPNTHPDERALRWHVFVWDLWFLAWGLVLGLALLGYRRRRRDAGVSDVRAHPSNHDAHHCLAPRE